MAVKQNPILYNGTGQPYMALFDESGSPIMNPITNIPLGQYVSTWNYMYDEEKENLATITIDTGDPDTVDIAGIQEGQNIVLQWGYVYPDGQFISSPVKVLKVRDFEAVFDTNGTHITIKCIDAVGDLRFSAPYTYSDDAEYKLSTYLDKGLGKGIGVIIEIFS